MGQCFGHVLLSLNSKVSDQKSMKSGPTRMLSHPITDSHDFFRKLILSPVRFDHHIRVVEDDEVAGRAHLGDFHDILEALVDELRPPLCYTEH